LVELAADIGDHERDGGGRHREPEHHPHRWPTHADLPGTELLRNHIACLLSKGWAIWWPQVRKTFRQNLEPRADLAGASQRVPLTGRSRLALCVVVGFASHATTGCVVR